ncbi:extracellular solute-binding protein [Desulfovibrio sp. OttesenSCG-928-I05]|nr:extracellular solute-binding protein [Desulfovibrio sp. OttesenSCG-928-I05]
MSLKKITALASAAVLAATLFASAGIAAPQTAPAPGSAGTMTLYYAPTTDWADPIIQEFQELTGVKVEMINAGASELFSRVIAEKDNPLADVVWGGSADTYATYKQYLQSYQSTEHAAINSSCTFPGNYAYGWCMEPSLFVYNNKLLAASEAPKSWADLTDPKWKGKIALADPMKSSSAFGALVTFYQACGEEMFKKFVQNLDGKVVNGTSNVYKYVSDGEYLIGIAFEELGMKYKTAGANIELVYPEEGIPMAPSALGIVANCKNPENAQKFVDFMIGKTVQAKMAGLFRRSARTDMPAPDTLPDLSTLKIMENYDPAWAASNGSKLSALFRDLITQ